MSQPCPHLGLIISVTRHASATERDADAMHDDLIAALAANGLAMAGAARRAPEYIVVREGGQATEADRSLLSEWATSWAHVAAVAVSMPIDLSDDA
jgi:uncharacterized protein YggL (DUF469 family)